jgi:hypothetical protein
MNAGAATHKKQCVLDCGTGMWQHGRQKSQCVDCGTGYCKHGRQKPEEPVRRLRHGLLQAPAPQVPVQGLQEPIDNSQ